MAKSRGIRKGCWSKVAAHQLNQELRAIDAKYGPEIRREAIDKEMAKIQAEVRFEKAILARSLLIVEPRKGYRC